MLKKFGVLFALLLIGLFAVACAQATPQISPTVAPTAIPPPPATAVPPTALPALTATTAPTADPHVAGADCKSCHTQEHQRWSLTLHAADAAAVLTNEEHNTAELLTNECIGCHAPFQAAKFTIADFVQPIDQKGPWAVVEKNAKAWEAIKCEVCHDPTSKAPKKLAFYDPATQAYAAVKDTTALCEKCHQAGTDDSRNLAGSVHEGLQCAKCHFQPGTEMSLDPKESCKQCHPGVNPNHPDVMLLDTTFKDINSKNNIHFISCATCHPKGTPTPAK